MDISISSVTERDVDFLMLEEFVASPLFLRWFVEKVTKLELDEDALVSIRRSVTTSNGESDLELAVAGRDGGIYYFLIENKVASSFQPRQAQRYRERGLRYVREGECVGFTTVLIAPRSYFGRNPQRLGFDAVVSYEDLRTWFKEKSAIGVRARVKVRLLSDAIQKSRSGYQPVQDQVVTAFWKSYWELASELAPELEMREPGGKPSGAGFVWFRPSVLPRSVTIVHKLPWGNVDLQFHGMGKDLEAFRRAVEDYLEPDMSVARANKSAAVRLKTAPLETTLPFSEQADLAKKGIRAATKLLRWYLRVGENLDIAGAQEKLRPKSF